MAERVDRIPGSRAGGVPKYPWEEWLDGSLWKLIQGKDFECKPESMHSVAKTAARNRHVAVEVHQRGDRIYIQAQR